MTECGETAGYTAGIGIRCFLLSSGEDAQRVCLFLAYCIGHGP